MKKVEDINERFQSVAEITIRLGFLLLLIAWCLRLLYPFSGIIVWGIILALAAAPMHNSLSRIFGNKPKRAAVILVVAGLALIILPAWLFLDSLLEGVQELKKSLDSGTFAIPPPSAKVADWPLIGDDAYKLWSEASENLSAFTNHYYEQISELGNSLLDGLASIGGSIVQLILSTIIAGVLLATPGTEQVSRKFFRKLAGKQGDDFTSVISQTVGNVLKGVIGVAFIQSVLIGLGLLISGVPHAGAWTLVALIMAILQLPVLLIVLPAIIWLFSAMNPLPATLWTIYLLAAGASDNLIKPILLGKGAAVPTVVIFLGVIGGFMMSGFIGLFTGAIIASIGYKLLVSWLNSDEAKPTDNQTIQLTKNDSQAE